MKTKIIFLFLPLMVLFGCAAAEQTSEQKEKPTPEVYVFDDVSKADTTKIETAKKQEVKVEQVKADQPVTNNPAKKYVIQLGAFTTKERADFFVSENQSRTSLPMNISFNAQTKFYVVQLPPYGTKEEADLIRDNLRKFPAFKGAFTTTAEK